MQSQSSRNSALREMRHINPYFGNWFAGFVDGEASFAIPRRQRGRGYGCAFRISLRRDDRPILVEIQQTLEVGAIRDYESRQENANPQSELAVSGITGCYRLVCVFDRFPLRAKKAQDYAIWREAVLELINRGKRRGKRDIDWSRMAELRTALMEGRKYEGSDIAVTAPIPGYVQPELL